MKTSTLLIFFGLAFFYLASPAIAQEDDAYDDYSYLWEDSKAKAKEAKLKAKEEKKRQKELEKMRKKGLLPDTTITEESTAMDTIQSKPDSIQSVSDSIQTVSDTTTQQYSIPSDTIKTPVDTVRQEVIEEPLDEEVLEDEVEEPKKEKEKRDLSGPPVEDFRSGMSSGGGGSSFDGGLTVTQIDDQWYAGMTLNPELNLGKVGVGLNIPILYGLDDKSIRTEIFEDGVGVARLITYLRLGVQKTDPIYFKVGQLNNTMIGFGGLVNNYTNSTSFEKRKVGIHYDFNVKGLVGIDGLYSDFNFSSLNLLAVRPYIRPMAWSSIPIVKTFEIGTTFMKDNDQTKLTSTDSTFTTYGLTSEGIGAFGLDAGLTLLRVPFIQIDLFATYSKLNVQSDSLDQIIASSTLSTLDNGFQDGSGASVGLNFRFHFIADILALDARIERLNYTEHYLPQFFDATYEINKDAKIASLLSAEEMSGIYGSLTGHILKKVEIGGSLMIPDNISAETPATVRVHADLDRLADKFSFHGSYIKGNLTDLGDAFTFDEQSLAKIRVIYHLNKFLATGLDYYWAFTPTGDGGYRATKYVSPYFGLSIAF